jgi:hypothetical protein
LAQGKLDDWLTERANMNKLIREHRVRAQYSMKRQADKDRSERVFDVDTMIYLKLQPYVQSSIFSRANQKLSFKYFGPFHIRVGAVAYHLELPDNSAIHPVVHVSQLKLPVEFKGTASNQLPSELLQFHIPCRCSVPEWFPEAIPGDPGAYPVV